METETYPSLTTERDGHDKPHVLTTLGASDRYRVTVRLSDDDLRAIVQTAYDHHGILAEPSMERELARAAELDRWPTDPGLREFADAWGKAVSEPGRCPCGLPGCSDAVVSR